MVGSNVAEVVKLQRNHPTISHVHKPQSTEVIEKLGSSDTDEGHGTSWRK